MNERIIRKYALDELLNSDLNAFAVTDDKFKILTFSKSFKNTLGSKRLKGILLTNLINIPHNRSISTDKGNFYFLNHQRKKHSVIIKPLINREIIKGYLVEIELREKADNGRASEFSLAALLTQQQEILSLLLKENSLTSLATEIIKRCASLSNSTFAVSVFYSDNKPNDYIFYDPEHVISDENNIKKFLNTNLAYINKWLYVNKVSLLINNSPDNIGYNLLKEFEENTAVIAPCFFEDKLQAIIIAAKKEGDFNLSEMGNIEQIATLLSFAITSIRTRELNTTLENRLLQAQKLETIGKLSSGMAHDFNNLLSSIFGSLNLLKKRVPDRNDIYRLLDNIENCSVRAKDLTKGLLSFGKPTPKRKELVKPNILLSEISKVISQTFPAKINFTSNIDQNLYDILGSGTEIYQVLLNLCVNAKEAIDDKGSLQLKARNISIDKKLLINHPLLNLGNYVWFSVEDSGAGINEENLNKIFDPYFSTKNKSTGSGSGLGLYVTYGIIKAHNGNIEVSSVPGKGTTFDVFIPAYEPNKALKPAVSEKIILLVDDEIMLRDLLAELLESYGYNIIKVVSGNEALKVLTEEIKVDLAIIDYNMPGMDGLECIEKIRQLNFDIPVILSSGSMSILTEKDLKHKKINAIVSKPYEFEMMLETIQKLI